MTERGGQRVEPAAVVVEWAVSALRGHAQDLRAFSDALLSAVYARLSAEGWPAEIAVLLMIEGHVYAAMTRLEQARHEVEGATDVPPPRPQEAQP